MPRAMPFAVGAASCLVLVLLTIAFVDRPVAFWVHGLAPAGATREALIWMQDIAALPGYAAMPVVAIAGIWRASGYPLVAWANTWLLAEASYLIADGLKNELKYGFGRAWPETWVAHNPSLIHDGVFGFFPFHGGAGWASFPSGHMTAVTAFTVVIALCWRPGWVLVAVASGLVAIGLLGLDYHFVSDMIAGSALGSGVALGLVRLSAQTER